MKNPPCPICGKQPQVDVSVSGMFHIVACEGTARRVKGGGFTRSHVLQVSASTQAAALRLWAKVSGNRRAAAVRMCDGEAP